MPLPPTSVLEQLIYDADVVAQGGVLAPDAAARLRARAAALAVAIDSYIRAATVVVTATNAPGQVVVTDPVTGTGATTTPGSVTGTGTIT